MDRYLPARGFERTAFLVLVALALAAKVLAIFHFRSDSDETQHAHVVWGWVTGQLQYKDVFDNHMPLFQMLCAPIMALIGVRPDVMIWLRWAMLPLYFVSIWCVFRLAVVLGWRRAAPWCALFAAVLWKFFYTSTEFRTDQLWTAFWLLSLVVAVNGEFTVKRAFQFGLLLGLSGAVSIKTVPLTVALGAAAALAMIGGWLRGNRPRPMAILACLAVIIVGMAIPPATMALYFEWRGAFDKMLYGVIKHNLVPGLKRWDHVALYQWYFPLSFPASAALMWLIFRQTPDTRLAIRRAIITLVPWIYLCLLLSYWPDITREDDLPYIPLTTFTAIPLLTLAGATVRSERLRRLFWTYGLPAAAACNFAFTWHFHNLREDRLQITTHNIANVLEITNPNDYVMDDKGDYVYRRRAYFWVSSRLPRPA